MHAEVLAGLDRKTSGGEHARVQTQRIMCRMLGDLILPSVHRSGATPPWAPDMHGGRIRLRDYSPFTALPPQCDVGFPAGSAVSWADVLALLPALADEAAMDSLTAAIRARAFLLDDDSLCLVNPGPRFAFPSVVDCPQLVHDGDTCHWMRSVQSAITSCRPLSARMLPLQKPHEKLLMRPPHPAPAASTEAQQANLQALQQHFHPERFVTHLVVDFEDGMASLHVWGTQSGIPQAASIYNQLWIRAGIMRFLEEAMVHAPYRHRLIAALGTDTPSFAAVERAIGSPRPLINALVSTLSRSAVDKLSYWPQTPNSIQRRNRDFIMLEPEQTLMFSAPIAASSDADFLSQLLSASMYVLVPYTSITHFFGAL